MQKLITFSIYIVLLVNVCSAVPLSVDSQWQADDFHNAGKYQHQTIHEVVHVHNVPVQIPLYASLVVHDSKRPQYVYKQHPQGSIILTVHKGPVTNDYCVAPNEAGFSQLFREVYALLPKQRIAKIISNAMKYDAEARNFLKLLYSKDTQEQLASLKSFAEFAALSEYACNRVHLNLNHIFKIAKLLLSADEQNINNISMLDERSKEDFKSHGGVAGMLKQIYDILPRDELHALYQRLKDSDAYFITSMQEIKAPEFRQLTQNMRQLPAYKKLRQTLINGGFPVADYNKLVASALGWQDEEVFRIFYV